MAKPMSGSYQKKRKTMAQIGLGFQGGAKSTKMKGKAFGIGNKDPIAIIANQSELANNVSAFLMENGYGSSLDLMRPTTNVFLDILHYLMFMRDNNYVNHITKENMAETIPDLALEIEYYNIYIYIYSYPYNIGKNCFTPIGAPNTWCTLLAFLQHLVEWNSTFLALLKVNSAYNSYNYNLQAVKEETEKEKELIYYIFNEYDQGLENVLRLKDDQLQSFFTASRNLIDIDDQTATKGMDMFTEMYNIYIYIYIE